MRRCRNFTIAGAALAVTHLNMINDAYCSIKLGLVYAIEKWGRDVMADLEVSSFVIMLDISFANLLTNDLKGQDNDMKEEPRHK